MLPSATATCASPAFVPIATTTTTSRRDAWKPRSRSLDDLREVLHAITSAADESGDEERMAEPKSLGLGLLQYPSAHGGSSVWRAALKQQDAAHSDDDLDDDEQEAGDAAAGQREAAPADGRRVPRALASQLFPVRVLPQHVPRATEIQSFLSRIECVEINAVVERDDDVVYYVLDVFRHRQQNGIPTRLRATTAPPSSASSTLAAQLKLAPVLTRSASSQPREPDYQLEHRFSSFARLRANVLQVARKRHRRGGGHGCSYCSALVTFFLESDAQPDLKAKFTTNTEARKQLLCRFINGLLAAARDNHVLCSRAMRGYHQIPMLMKRFLSEQTGENFFS